MDELSPTQEGSRSIVGRRTLASVAGIAAAAGLVYSRPAFASTDASYQNVVTNGADATGSNDSSPAFNAAWANLPSTGGTIYIPGGIYKLNSELNFQNKALNLIGDGSAATVLLVNHTAWAVVFDCSATGVNAEEYPLNVSGLSFAGVSQTGPAAGAISASFGVFNNETGYQSCCISDIGIGNAYQNRGGGGCNISSGLLLVNIWKSHIENVRMFGNPSGSGAAFITLSSSGGGLCIDNTFTNCYHDGNGPSFCFAYDSKVASPIPFQGVNILSPKFITNTTAISTVFASNQNPTILNLFLRGGTISAPSRCLDLYSVAGAFISDTWFSCNSSSTTAMINVANCNAISIANSMFNGPGANPANACAISLSGAQNRVSNIIMGNVAVGIRFISPCLSSFATALMFGSPTQGNWALATAAIDSSGQTGQGRNNAQWLSVNGSFTTLY